MQTTSSPYRSRVAGKRRDLTNPNAPQTIVVTGMTEGEADTLNAIVEHRNHTRVDGFTITRNAMIAAGLKALVASDGPAALAWRAERDAAAKPAPKKRAKKGGAQ